MLRAGDSMKAPHIELLDNAKALACGNEIHIGSAFVFIDAGTYAPSPEVHGLLSNTVEVGGARIGPVRCPSTHIACVTSDRVLYGASDPITVFASARPDERAPLIVARSGATIEHLDVALGEHGCGVARLSPLSPGRRRVTPSGPTRADIAPCSGRTDRSPDSPRGSRGGRA